MVIGKSFFRCKRINAWSGDESPLTPHLMASKPNVSHLIKKLTNCDRKTERKAFDQLATRVGEINSPSSLVSLMRIPSTLHHMTESSTGYLDSPTAESSPISSVIKELLSPKNAEQYSCNKYQALMELLSRRLINIQSVSTAKELAIVSWACGRSNFRHSALTKWLIQGIEELVEKDMSHIKRIIKNSRSKDYSSSKYQALRCTPGLISSFLWFASKNPSESSASLCRDLAFIAAYQLNLFNDQDFTTLYNSIALMTDIFKSSNLLPSQPRNAKKLSQIIQLTSTFKPQQTEKNDRGVILCAKELPSSFAENGVYVCQVILLRLKSLDARRLANFLWAATKCSDWLSRCPVVGVHLINHIIHVDHLNSYNAQHVSNLYWSCGQILGSSGPRDDSTPNDDYDDSDYVPYQKGSNLFALDCIYTKTTYTVVDLRDYFGHLYETLSAFRFSLNVFECLSCQGLTIIFAAHARIGHCPPSRLLHVLITRLTAVVSHLHHQHIGHIWWTLGQLRRSLVDILAGKHEEIDASSVENFITSLTSESVKRRQSLSVIQWANLLLGAGEMIQVMRMSESEQVRKLAQYVMSHIFPTKEDCAYSLKHHVHLLEGITSQCDSLLTASNCLEGMAAAKWVQEAVLTALNSSILYLLKHFTPLGHQTMSPVERDHASRMLGGLSALCRMGCVEWTYLSRGLVEIFSKTCNIIYSSLIPAVGQVQCFSATFVARLVHAMASANFRHEQLLLLISRILIDTSKLISTKTPARIEIKLWTSVLWALARLNVQPPQNLFYVASQRLDAICETDSTRKEGIIGTWLWSLSIVNYPHFHPNIQLAVQRNLPLSLDWVLSSTPHHEQLTDVMKVDEDSTYKSEIAWQDSWTKEDEARTCHANHLIIAFCTLKLFHPDLFKSLTIDHTWPDLKILGIDTRQPADTSKSQQAMDKCLIHIFGKGENNLLLEHQLPELGLWCDAILPYCSCPYRGTASSSLCSTCNRLVGSNNKGLVIELDGPFHFLATGEKNGKDWEDMKDFSISRKHPQEILFRGRSLVVGGSTRWKYEILVKEKWDVLNINFIELQVVDINDVEVFSRYIMARIKRYFKETC